jgi:hypothetical protein
MQALTYPQASPEGSKADEKITILDLEEVRINFFDVRRPISRDALELAARAFQDAMKLKKAPSIELLQSMREWQHRMTLPMWAHPDWTGFLLSIGRGLPPEPTQTAADAKSGESSEDSEDSVVDSITALNIREGVEAASSLP